MKKIVVPPSLRCTLAALLALAGTSVSAQSYPSYPSYPVRIIVPTSAGGGVDTIARLLGRKLSDAWAQPVVVENRPGATGVIGMEAAAKAPADGYTLVLCTNAMLTISPYLYSHPGYDPVHDLAPITLAASSPFLLVVHPSMPVKSVKELIAFARAHPGEINYSSSGNGSATHMAGVLFDYMAHVKMVHVPYKGSSLAITDLLAGQTQMRFSALVPTLPHVRAGKLRALAVTSERRFRLMPDVPTVMETVPGYTSGIWYGVLAPAATPAPLLARLHDVVTRQLKSAAVGKRLEADGSALVANSTSELATGIQADVRRWQEIIRRTGLKVQ
jgi:tripartite-type tricarboxylate transporter receptor subunit TctC